MARGRRGGPHGRERPVPDPQRACGEGRGSRQGRVASRPHHHQKGQGREPTNENCLDRPGNWRGCPHGWRVPRRRRRRWMRTRSSPRPQIKWAPGPASIPAGAEAAVLYGDPSKEGLFALRLKLPKDYRIPPHTHPKPEVVTVISGTFRLGNGRGRRSQQGPALAHGQLLRPASGYGALCVRR